MIDTENYKTYKDILDKYYPNAVMTNRSTRGQWEEFAIPGCKYVSIYANNTVTLAGMDDYIVKEVPFKFKPYAVTPEQFEDILKIIRTKFPDEKVRKPLYKVTYVGCGGIFSDDVWTDEALQEWMSDRHWIKIERIED